MEEGSYQFIHVDSYGREGSTQTKTSMNKHGAKVTTATKSRSAKEILDEQWREDGACPHIKNPSKPGLLFGAEPSKVLPIMNEWADQAKDAQGRKLRKDGNCILIGVASLPRSMEDNFPEFAEDTLEWLKEKYGDRLKSVVVHNDESHPHLHFTVVPHIGERFDEIHEGIKAKNGAKKDGKKAGEQNLAYIGAMRAMQDEFSKKVAMAHGLTRLGPGRRRLTRAAWHAEKKQAAYFADAQKVALIHARKGYKVGIKQAKDQAREIILNAQNEAKSLGNKFSALMAGFFVGWHKPTVKVQNEIQKIKIESELNDRRNKIRLEDEKKNADIRVANVSNQLTVEKQKVHELESELKQVENKLQTLNIDLTSDFKKSDEMKLK
jgi:Plasmid recombination enzyme